MSDPSAFRRFTAVFTKTCYEIPSGTRKSSPSHHTLFLWNTVLESHISPFYKWALSIRIYSQNFVCIYRLSKRTTRPNLLTLLFDYTIKSVGKRIQTIKLLRNISQLLISCLKSNHSPRNFFLRHLWSMSQV